MELNNISDHTDIAPDRRVGFELGAIAAMQHDAPVAGSAAAGQQMSFPTAPSRGSYAQSRRRQPARPLTAALLPITSSR